MTTLILKEPPTVPLEAEILTPDVMAPLRHDAIAALPVFLGKRQRRLDDFFTVEGDGSDELEIHGDLAKFKWIGRGMTHGKITILGNVGMHLGAYMKGGTIEVHGNASDWLGAEMLGGRIRIRGSVGNFVGAALPGSRSGMTEGLIFVEGTAGDDVGLSMRRGLIAILGDAGQGAGRSMIAGTILLGRNVGGLVGAGMKRGSVVMLNPNLEPNDLLLPTFVRAGQFPANFLILYKRQLEAWGLAIPHSEAVLGAPFERYNGDTVNGGQGEVLLRSRDHDGRKLWEAKVGS